MSTKVSIIPDRKMDSSPILKQALKDFFGFDTFKGKQEEIVNNIYEGNNTFVIMPTGAGKSLCYQLPAIVLEGTAIIISPLIALMKNQVDSIRAYSGTSGIAEFLNSSLTKNEIKRVKDSITAGITKMLFVAPESLGKVENIEFFKSVKISFVAVDEAHCISEWGHDFRPEYRKIKTMIQEIGNVPIMALTATATPKVQADIQKNLQMLDAKVYKMSFNRPNLYYEVRPKIDAEKSIIRYIKENAGKSGIVYTLSRKKAETIAEILQANNIKALPYHAGLDAPVRAKHQDMFLMEDVDVIVATIAFGMGIDKPDVRFVIHYDIPKSIESYYQETGRAGRDGMEGVCISYFSYDDINKLQKFMKDKSVAEKEIGTLLISEMVNYAESAVCRRKQILHYFGESFNEKDCGKKCDTCKQNPKKLKIKEELVYLLETINTLGKKFEIDHILNFVQGISSDKILSYNHQNHPLFGEGKTKDFVFWKSLIKYAVYDMLISKDIEYYGTLKVSEKGEEYLKKPVSVEFALDIDYSQARVIENGVDQMESADPVLFDLLKELRKKLAKEKNIPPYVIFQDPSLEEMAMLYPISMDDMLKINGVGSGKATKFARPFIELISKYVIDNEIDRPVDLFDVKSTVNKSKGKVFIISSIDRKLSLSDIANSQGMIYSELFTELITIVNSGTKVNIDYHINEVMDKDLQDEVFEYFRNSQSDDLEIALKTIGEDYSEEEIQLMRIKFLSEVGN